MNTINPFSDDSFKKQLLESEGISPTDDYEILGPADEKSEFKKIIANIPSIPKQAKNIILDASALSKNDKEAKANELNLALNDVLSNYNKEYGTNLQVDFTNTSRTLIMCSDPIKRRTLELALSEIFQSIRPILILSMISKMSLAIDYILSPERLFGGELQLTDIWLAIEKLLGFIGQLESMKDEILIKGADIELRKIGDKEKEISSNDLDKSTAVQEFMEMFKKDNGI